VRIPVIELVEIGAGGGSIARIDALACSQSAPTAPAPNPARPATAAAAPSRP
jgi:N-methylhydantoinase A